MNEHVDDRAALYALGALGDDESAAVQAHVATCPQCAAAIGDAERDVALLVSQQPQREAPAILAARVEQTLRPRLDRRFHAAFVALAAAFLIGILPSAYFWERERAMESEMVVQRAAMARLVAAPHRIASFHTNGGSLAADVMYAPDGSWYVVLIKGVSQSLSLAWMHDGQHTMLGTATPHSGVAMLYLPKSHRMRRLALMQGEVVVAEAQLPY